jgi:acylphosphatase
MSSDGRLSCYNPADSQDNEEARCDSGRSGATGVKGPSSSREVQAYVLLVSGRVQGVGFRWFAEREALKRNVTGYVRNLTDGRVEIWAQAEDERLGDFCEAIRRGPPASRVDEVAMKAVPADGSFSTFRVRF